MTPDVYANGLGPRVVRLEKECDRLHAINAALVTALERVKQGCLFSEDDSFGQIGVTEHPCIDKQLFNDICAALAKANGESP